MQNPKNKHNAKRSKGTITSLKESLGEKVQKISKPHAFLVSPDDPYFLPSSEDDDRVRKSNAKASRPAASTQRRSVAITSPEKKPARASEIANVALKDKKDKVITSPLGRAAAKRQRTSGEALEKDAPRRQETLRGYGNITGSAVAARLQILPTKVKELPHCSLEPDEAVEGFEGAAEECDRSAAVGVVKPMIHTKSGRQNGSQPVPLGRRSQMSGEQRGRAKAETEGGGPEREPKLSMSREASAIPSGSTAAELQSLKPLKGSKAVLQSNKPKQPSRLAKTTRCDDLSPPGDVPAPPHASEAKTPHAVPTNPAMKLADVCMPQMGLRTPLLMRNALSAGLGRVLSGRAFRTPAPALTVMEAQESGEQMEIQDSLLYALDGLCGSSSTAILRQSAASLVEICATRRGRAAVRNDGVFLEATSAAKRLLSQKWDPELAIAFAAILFFFSQEPASHEALASKEAAQLLRILLQSGKEGVLSRIDLKGEHSAAVKRTHKLLQQGSLAKKFPSHIAASPAAVAVLTTIDATEPQNPSEAAELLKASLRKHGILDTLSEVVDNWTKHTDQNRSNWLLHKYLLCLENCSFACPENEAYLVGLQQQAGASPSAQISSTLVKLVRCLGDATPDAGDSDVSDCLHCALSVLMNITHHNDAGCRQVNAAGGLECVARLLCLTLEGRSKQELLGSINIISVTIGVLINIAENSPGKMRTLVDVELPRGARFLPLLCNLMEEFTPKTSDDKDEAVSEDQEITIESLAEHEEEGRAAIVQVYSALLIGFLIAPSTEHRLEAEKALSGKSLAPVIAGVQRCLSFYMDTGTITEKTENSLRSLLSSLNRDV